MELIKIGTPVRYSGYTTIPYTFYLPIPDKFSELSNKLDIARSYGYDIDGGYLTYNSQINVDDKQSDQSIKDNLESMYNQSVINFNNFQLTQSDTIIGLKFDGENWI